MEYRKRVTTSLPEEEYSLLNYFAYCLYPPLYIAGPIVTFNDFVWQVRVVLSPRLTTNSYGSPLLYPGENNFRTSSASLSASSRWKVSFTRCMSLRSKIRQHGVATGRRI